MRQPLLIRDAVVPAAVKPSFIMHVSVSLLSRTETRACKRLRQSAFFETPCADGAETIVTTTDDHDDHKEGSNCFWGSQCRSLPRDS